MAPGHRFGVLMSKSSTSVWIYVGSFQFRGVSGYICKDCQLINSVEVGFEVTTDVTWKFIVKSVHG